MFSSKNCVYSFFCCSFLEKLCTRFYPLGIFFTAVVLLLLFFLLQYQYLSTVRLTKASFLVIRFFSLFLLYFLHEREVALWTLI